MIIIRHVFHVIRNLARRFVRSKTHFTINFLSSCHIFYLSHILLTLFYLKLLSCARSFRLSNVNRYALITIRGRCNGRRFRNSCSSGSANYTRVLVQQLRTRYRNRWLFEPRPADTVTCNTEHNNSHLPPPACCRHQGISRSIRQLFWQAKWARKEVDIRRVWCPTAVNNNRHIILPGNHDTQSLTLRFI